MQLRSHAPKIHPGANYTYMYNIHPVCKSAHVNGALDSHSAPPRSTILMFLRGDDLPSHPVKNVIFI